MNKMVLIVEDDDASAKMFKELIRLKGHQTQHAASGWDAMKLAAQHPPDLIIMDIKLPDISGVKTIRMLKTSGQFMDTPIIAVTAFPKELTMKICLEAGADTFLSKPISVVEFQDEVTRLLG